MVPPEYLTLLVVLNVFCWLEPVGVNNHRTVMAAGFPVTVHLIAWDLPWWTSVLAGEIVTFNKPEKNKVISTWHSLELIKKIFSSYYSPLLLQISKLTVFMICNQCIMLTNVFPKLKIGVVLWQFNNMYSTIFFLYSNKKLKCSFV